MRLPQSSALVRQYKAEQRHVSSNGALLWFEAAECQGPAVRLEPQLQQKPNHPCQVGACSA